MNDFKARSVAIQFFGIENIEGVKIESNQIAGLPSGEYEISWQDESYKVAMDENGKIKKVKKNESRT